MGKAPECRATAVSVLGKGPGGQPDQIKSPAVPEQRVLAPAACSGRAQGRRPGQERSPPSPRTGEDAGRTGGRRWGRDTALPAGANATRGLNPCAPDRRRTEGAPSSPARNRGGTPGRRPAAAGPPGGSGAGRNLPSKPPAGDSSTGGPRPPYPGSGGKGTARRRNRRPGR